MRTKIPENSLISIDAGGVTRVTLCSAKHRNSSDASAVESFIPPESSGKFAKIISIKQVFTSLNEPMKATGETLVVWPNALWQSLGGRSSWEQLPATGFRGKIVHIWVPFHPRRECRSHAGVIYLLCVKELKGCYVPVMESGIEFITEKDYSTFMLLILIAVLIKVSHQQSVVVTGWYGTGKSVKYMTIANNLVSSDGNIVPNRFKPRKEGSSTVYDCVDVQGTVRRHGDQYMRPNKRFKYTCTNGVEEVKSCMSSERIGLVEIPVGQTLTKDGLWYNCTHFPQNQTAIYTEAKACEVNNRTYGVGDTIRTGFFLMECTENGYKVIGCYYIDKDKKIVDMVPGSMRKSEGQEYYCNITGNNPKYYVQDVSCKRYGRTLQDGEQFLANHLQYECRNGLVKIIGCYIQENGKILSPGQDVIEKNMVYRCYRVNSTLHYVEYACGYNGTPNCQPEPMKNEPEESVGTYNRGFAVQSVVSQIQRASSQFMTGSNATYANLSGIATING